jgi:L-threonylcarbamoyladenylate synthase
MNTKIFKINDVWDERSCADLEECAEVIKRGGLVVFPTETVYGLGADGTNADAARKIYAAKGRPSDNPLIIHIAHPSDAEKYVYVNDTYKLIAEAFMPGPITVVLPARDDVPMQTRANLPTVAVRCPSHPVAKRLIQLAGVPIAAPSANLSGSPSPTKAEHVIDDMQGRVDIIIDGGEAEFGLESTIVKIDSNGAVTLLRPGKITVSDLEAVCGPITVAAAVTAPLGEGETVLSPGMKYRHYAPKSPLYLVDGDAESFVKLVDERSKLCRVAVLCYASDKTLFEKSAPGTYTYAFGDKTDEISQAHLLFDILRDCDKRGFDEIYAPVPTKAGIGLALYNRMIRAAAYHIIKL